MRHTLLALALAGALLAFLSSIWSSDAGCILDPDGECGPAPRPDEGCILDPNGACRPQGS